MSTEYCEKCKRELRTGAYDDPNYGVKIWGSSQCLSCMQEEMMENYQIREQGVEIVPPNWESAFHVLYGFIIANGLEDKLLESKVMRELLGPKVLAGKGRS